MWSRREQACGFLAPHPPTPVSGFTFIELIFVAVTIAVLLAAALPRYGKTLTRLRAERAAFEIAQLLRYAQSSAVLRQQTVQCGMVASGAGAQGPVRIVRLSVGDEPLRDRFASSAGLPQDLAITIESDEAPADQIWFFPNGSSEASRIIIAYDETHPYTITVDAATGRTAVLAGAAAR